MIILKVSMRYIYKVIANSIIYFSIFLGSVHAQDVIVTDIIIEGLCKAGWEPEES